MSEIKFIEKATEAFRMILAGVNMMIEARRERMRPEAAGVPIDPHQCHPCQLRDLENRAAEVKDFIMGFLSIEGIITEDQYADLLNNYIIVVRKPTFFNILFRSKDADRDRYIMVRQCSLVDGDNDPVKLTSIAGGREDREDEDKGERDG